MTAAAPRFLILETSGRVGQVTLAEGSQMRAIRRLDEARRHARDLAPAVKALLAEQRWGPRDLQAVIVSRGPGSYTGLRVGVMSAKALAYATGCALLAIDTFAAIAWQTPPEASRVEVLADAQQDKVYVQRFERSDPAAAPMALSALNIQPFAQWLNDHEPQVWATGPGLRGQEGRLPKGCRVVANDQWDPRPESLLALALERWAHGERDDFWAVEPLYLRPSAAEEKWRQT